MRQMLLLAIVSMLQAAALAVTLYASQWYWKQPYHTSALTGEMWVNELIYGHPDRIRHELRMRVHVYLSLVAELRYLGLSDSRNGAAFGCLATYSSHLPTLAALSAPMLAPHDHPELSRIGRTIS